jgi:hypothetical protein
MILAFRRHATISKTLTYIVILISISLLDRVVDPYQIITKLCGMFLKRWEAHPEGHVREAWDWGNT